MREESDGIVAGGGGGLAVAAEVIAEDTKNFAECGDLPFPEREVGAEGVGEHQHWSIGRAVELVMDAEVFGFGEGHGYTVYFLCCDNFLLTS